jgi:hypothetical protein
VLQGVGDHTVGCPCAADCCTGDHLDLVGPLPLAENDSTYLIMLVGKTTLWLEATPLRSMDAAVCAKAYGVPKAVNREDKRSRRYRDRHFAKFERSRRYRDP